LIRERLDVFANMVLVEPLVGAKLAAALPTAHHFGHGMNPFVARAGWDAVYVFEDLLGDGVDNVRSRSWRGGVFGRADGARRARLG
jgi:hypothetical protein